MWNYWWSNETLPKHFHMVGCLRNVDLFTGMFSWFQSIKTHQKPLHSWSSWCWIISYWRIRTSPPACAVVTITRAFHRTCCWCRRTWAMATSTEGATGHALTVEWRHHQLTARIIYHIYQSKLYRKFVVHCSLAFWCIAFKQHIPSSLWKIHFCL